MLVTLPEIQLLVSFELRGMRCLHVGACELEELPGYTKAGIVDIVWIEARPAAVHDMRAKHPDQTILQACVSNVTGKHVLFRETINDSNDHQQSSMLPIHAGNMLRACPSLRITKSYHLQSWRIDDLLATQNINPEFQFLNVDVQGAELLALQGISDAMWQTIKIVYVEFNAVEYYKGSPKPEQLHAFLVSKGFARKLTKWCGTTFGDSVYARPS